MGMKIGVTLMAGIQATPPQALGLSQPQASTATELDDDWQPPKSLWHPSFLLTFAIWDFGSGGNGTIAPQKKQRSPGKEGAIETITPLSDPLVCALCHRGALKTTRLTRRIQQESQTTGCCKRCQTHILAAHWFCPLPFFTELPTVTNPLFRTLQQTY